MDRVVWSGVRSKGDDDGDGDGCATISVSSVSLLSE